MTKKTKKATKHTFGVSMPKEIHEQLQALGESQHRSVSSILTILAIEHLNAYLKRNSSKVK